MAEAPGGTFLDDDFTVFANALRLPDVDDASFSDGANMAGDFVGEETAAVLATADVFDFDLAAGGLGVDRLDVDDLTDFVDGFAAAALFSVRSTPDGTSTASRRFRAVLDAIERSTDGSTVNFRDLGTVLIMLIAASGLRPPKSVLAARRIWVRLY